VPKALQQQLGDDATEAFVYVFNAHQHDMTEELLKRFDARLDARFDQLEQRFDQIDQRFDHIDQRFARVDQRFAQVDQRFEQIDRRFERVDERLGRVEEKVGSLRVEMSEGFGSLRTDMAAQRADLIKWMFMFWVGQAFAVLAYFRAGQYLAGR
jgi:chromosome segregation ATPase